MAFLNICCFLGPLIKCCKYPVNYRQTYDAFWDWLHWEWCLSCSLSPSSMITIISFWADISILMLRISWWVEERENEQTHKSINNDFSIKYLCIEWEQYHKIVRLTHSDLHLIKKTYTLPLPWNTYNTRCLSLYSKHLNYKRSFSLLRTVTVHNAFLFTEYYLEYTMSFSLLNT